MSQKAASSDRSSYGSIRNSECLICTSGRDHQHQELWLDYRGARQDKQQNVFSIFFCLQRAFGNVGIVLFSG